MLKFVKSDPFVSEDEKNKNLIKTKMIDKIIRDKGLSNMQMTKEGEKYTFKDPLKSENIEDILNGN